MTFTIYGRSTCAPCQMTKKHLTNKGAEFVYKDIDEDEAAMDYLKEKGVASLPYVEVAEDSWSGFRPDYINKYL